MAPIAEWMGADLTLGQFAGVFPNLADFDSWEHIIDKTALNTYDLV